MQDHASDRGSAPWASVAQMPFAAGALHAAYVAAGSYSQIPAAFADPKVAALMFAVTAGKTTLAAFLLLPALALAPRLFLRTPVVPGALASCLLAVLLTSYPHPGIALSTIAAVAGLVALALVLGFWVDRLAANSASWKQLARRLPAVAIAASCWVAAFYWLIHFPAKALARQQPLATAAAFSIVTVLLLVPLWNRNRSSAAARWAAALLLLPALQPVRTLWDISYRLEDPRKVIAAEPSIPRVILIVVDTLRADALHFQSPDARPTPNLDRFADESVVFEQAVSPAPWTYPAMNSMMTGVAPYLDERTAVHPTAPLPTLAEHLRSAGYDTRGISGNFLLFRPFRIAAGFREYDVYHPSPLGHTIAAGNVVDLFPQRFVSGGATRRISMDAISWLRTHADRDFFLWLHYLDPHAAYAPPREFLPDPDLPNPVWDGGGPETPIEERAIARMLYDSEVAFVDAEIGRVLDELRRLEIYDDSLVVLTADHGEEFWDHGDQGHGLSLYQELLHVPLVVRLPGARVRKRVRSFVPVQALMSTLLQLCGIDAQPAAGQAESVAGLLEADAEDVYRAPIVSRATRRGPRLRSVVIEGCKYVKNLESGEERLFDLAADPREQTDVAGDRPDVVERARNALAEHERTAAHIRKQYGLDEAKSDADGQQELLRRMRSLGYLWGAGRLCRRRRRLQPLCGILLTCRVSFSF